MKVSFPKKMQTDERGFSLVEMMIGMVMTLIIVGAFIDLFINQNKSYSSDSLRQETYLTGRIALDDLQREAMNAGTGLPGLFASIQIMDCGPDQPDTITFIYVPQTSINLAFATTPSPNANANSMKLSSSSDVNDLVVGDMLLIFDETDFNVIEVTNVNTSSRTVVFAPGQSVYNTSSGLAKAYDPTTTTITQVSVMSITVDQTDSLAPYLYKFKGSTTLGAVAHYIENLQVVIQFEDGDTASAANDSDSDLTNDSMDLRAVIITVSARSPRKDENHVDGGTDYWRQEFSSTISPRNIIY